MTTPLRKALIEAVPWAWSNPEDLIDALFTDEKVLAEMYKAPWIDRSRSVVEAIAAAARGVES